MKVAIIEDEPLAAEKLMRYLEKYSQEISVLITLPSLKLAIPWIKENQNQVDLFFMDIQLVDGISFEIFTEIEVHKPVVFTTAYDEYALDAFKVNSIDYLLKPITFSALSNAIKKLKSFKQPFNSSSLKPVIEHISSKKLKDRFLVKIGNHLKTIDVGKIYFFYAEGRDVFLNSQSGKKYIIDYNLEDILTLVDNKLFFRINRSYIVNLKAIKDVIVYSNRRLKLVLGYDEKKEMIVSREKVSEFKRWYEGV